MAQKSIVLIACVCALLGVPTGAPAQTFGDLHAHPETQAKAAGGFLADPIIARWLSSLPASASLEPAATDPAIALMLDGNPIGGDVYRLTTVTPPVSTEPAANPNVQAFDARPIGGRTYSIEKAIGRSNAVAENVVKQGFGAAKEGRSASRVSHRRAQPMQPKKLMSRAPGHNRLATGRSVATSPRYVPAPEGHADLPAPRGPARVWGVMPFTGW